MLSTWLTLQGSQDPYWTSRTARGKTDNGPHFPGKNPQVPIRSTLPRLGSSSCSACGDTPALFMYLLATSLTCSVAPVHTFVFLVQKPILSGLVFLWILTLTGGLSGIFMETACFRLSCWMKPVGIDVAGKIFHPNEGMAIRKQLDLWLRVLSHIQELVRVLELEREVAVQSGG